MRDVHACVTLAARRALPVRRLEAFLPGRGHGRRCQPLERPDLALGRIRPEAAHRDYESRYGANAIPADMPLQDWGVTYERAASPTTICSRSSSASPARPATSRARSSPVAIPSRPAQRRIPADAARDHRSGPDLQGGGAKNSATSRSRCRPPIRRRRIPIRTAMKLGPCQYCGHCERFICEAQGQGDARGAAVPDAAASAKASRCGSHAHVLGLDYDAQGEAGDRRALPRSA